MNILYIACSCSPYYGSEDKIGWSIPVMSAKENNVFVLTYKKNQKSIEKYLSSNKLENISFYYLDVPNVYKKIFRGFLLSGILNIWHKRAYKLAKNICKEKEIDIIHQITPVEFRSIGNYGKIKGVKFVCGPIGGGEYVPKGLKDYIGSNHKFEWIRCALNNWSRFKYKLTKKLKRCGYVLFANNETREYLKGLYRKSDSAVYSEIGILWNEISKPREHIKKDNQKPVFLVACRMVYRKGISFLLDAFGRLPENLEYFCQIVGDGPEFAELKEKSEKLGLKEKVTFVGKIPYEKMNEAYASADALIMPSIRETTGSVLLEASAKGIPVITINKYGGAVILNDDNGWLYEGNSKEEYIENLKNAIISCVSNPDELIRKGKNARENSQNYLWENKMAFYQSVYIKVLSEN